MRRLAAITGMLISLCGCGDGPGGPSGDNAGLPRSWPPVVEAKHGGDDPIDVVCTTGMVADLARNIGGEQVAVTSLMGAGVDPHLYKPVPSDIRKLRDADLIFYSGLHLEGKMAEVLGNLAKSQPVFAVAEYLPTEELLSTEEGAYDPHIWFDVTLWTEASKVVEEVLVDYDPDRAETYRQNAEAYRSKLAELDRYAREQIVTIPESRRVLITAHDAFRYFGKAYGIQVKGIQGISTESEASVRAINELVRFITDQKIKAVFVESSVSDRNMKALLEGCERNGHAVQIGGELFSDAMGKDGTPEGTYPGMVRHNVDTIVKALR